MKRVEDRPRTPFLRPDGTPRVSTVLSPAGPTRARTGEAIIDLRRFDDGTVAPARIVEQVAERSGVALRTDDADLPQAKRSGLLRVRFDPTQNDGREVLERVRKEFGDEAILPNAVFTVGGVTADPMHFTSVGADPMHFTSFGADPMHFTNSSSARPTPRPLTLDGSSRKDKGPGRPIVAILDTGFPADGSPLPSDVDFPGLTGTLRDRPDMNSDAYLDIAAGHSTFIRTIIQRGCPVVDVIVEGVIHNDGDGDEADIANALFRVFDAVPDKRQLIVNLSFSGYYDGDVPPPLIAFWIRELVDAGAVVVAAAGNDGACRKKFPAAMPEVLAVSALGPCGPASFSNHGSWVDVAAPGEDLISGFFDDFDGAYEPLVPGSVPDIDDFSGWAMWSGTSFATPTVVAALCEIVELCDCSARAAVNTLVRRPGLYRMPDYGVVVNRVF